MDAATFDILRGVRERHPREFGKVCQILLAISFCRIGFRRILERSIQGVDIDASEHETFANISIEVKTTLNHKVLIGKKDVRGLELRAADGYETAFAVLRIGLLAEWIVARAKGIPAGEIRIGRLETRSISELQNQVNAQFPLVLTDYATDILKRRARQVQLYLQECLSGEQMKAV